MSNAPGVKWYRLVSVASVDVQLLRLQRQDVLKDAAREAKAWLDARYCAPMVL
jgi:hypothetical protein